MREQGGDPLHRTLVQHIHVHRRGRTNLLATDPVLTGPYLTSPCSQDALRLLGYRTHECAGLDQGAGNYSGNRKNSSPGLGLYPASSTSQDRPCCGLCGKWKEHGHFGSWSQEVSQEEPSQSCLRCSNLGPKEASTCVLAPGGGPSTHPHLLLSTLNSHVPGMAVPSLLPQAAPFTGVWLYGGRCSPHPAELS